MLFVMSVMHEADNILLNPDHLAVLSAGLVSNKRIQLLIAPTKHFVRLFQFTAYAVFICALFIAVVSVWRPIFAEF